jgi:hypothetical protein
MSTIYQQKVARARGTPNLAIAFLLSSFLAGCATAYAPVALPSDHPASSQAAEAPPPPISRALATTDLARPAPSRPSGETPQEEHEGMQGMPGMGGMHSMHGGRQ